MQKIKRLLLIVPLLVLSFSSFAQEKTVSGTVLSARDNSPVANATVTNQNTKQSTTTNSAGRFTIRASKGDVLQVTHVSHQSMTLTVGDDNEIPVNLQVSEGQLGEVVVTALGIKKERKALGYAVTDLSAHELMKNKNTNVINSLVGKVPGVNVTQFSGSAGAGASITIRGGNSTSESRQNQPLFVIDGIIYDNSTIVTGNTGTDGLSRSNTTYSNRIMDVNPEDIESLSVLKGAAAAALYGSRAADGVVIITTKKGAAGAVTVNFNSKISTSSANKLPEAQTVFGRGFYATNGVFSDLNSYDSWGQKLTSSEPIYDNIGDFFQNGVI